ncbi:hypothetical protein [Streptomyces tremellae]|uniref:hypothetical protein n=1 Tax=Streptomyces tremellae TaxID=1124239 RepID=UPI0031E60200
MSTGAAEIERLWQVCAPALSDPPRPLPYARGTWGPREAPALPGERGWRVPEVVSPGPCGPHGRVPPSR